jgi:hypothetical protein
MKLKAKWSYTRTNGINPSAISPNGAVDMATSLRLCGLEFGELDASRSFDLTKACQKGLWKFATWWNFAQKKRCHPLNAIMTQFWMNIKWIETWFHHGNPFC